MDEFGNIEYDLVLENEKLEYERDEAIKKLAAYENAKQQGLLLVLPCRIGSKIYEANHNYGKVFQRFASKEDMLTKIVLGWGTRYFATPEEAEQALESEGE